MGYLHNFTVTVLLAAVLCFICEAMTVEGTLGRYTSIVTGLVVSLAIVSAVLQIKDIDFPAAELQIPSYAVTEEAQSEAVAAQFALDLKTAVETAVFEKFGVPVVVQATVSCADGVISVDALTVENEKISADALESFIKSQFGIVPAIT